MTPTSTRTRVEEDDSSVRGDARRIESLLDDLRDMMPLPTYQRVEELVQRLLRLHGVGLERLLDITLGPDRDTAGRDRDVTDGRVERICGDALVSSLLLIHGLHPQPAEARVRSALARLARTSGWHVELAGIDEAGNAHMRVISAGSPDRRGLIEVVVLDAAPELAGAVVDDGGASELVQLDVRRSKERR